MNTRRKAIMIMVVIGMAIAVTGIVDAGKRIGMDTPSEKTGNTTIINFGGMFGPVTYSEVDFGKDYDLKSFSDAGWEARQDIYGNMVLINPIRNFAEYVVVRNVPEKSPGITGLAAIMGLLGMVYLKRRN